MDRVQAELAQEKDGGGGQGGEAQGKVVALPVLSFRESLCDQYAVSRKSVPVYYSLDSWTCKVFSSLC